MQQRVIRAEDGPHASDPCWSITETDRVDARAADQIGSSFLLGNGYLGYRGTLEEDTRERMPATIVCGLYDRVRDLWREPVNVPNPLFLRIMNRGMPLDARASRLESHRQTLDLYRAALQRHTAFLTADGNRISVSSTRFVSLSALHLMCLRLTIEASADCTLSVVAGIDGDVWDLNGPHLRHFDSSVTDGGASLNARTEEKNIPIAVSQCVMGPLGTRVYRREDKRILGEFQMPLAAGSPWTVTLFATVHTGLDSADPAAAARALCAAAALKGFEKLFQEHCASWESRWKDCDIRIEGDAEAQLALRFSMYHLLAVAPAHAQNVSIPARGLSGQMYKGAIFWDTEIFMLPFFIHSFPRIARNLLMYRFHTLEGARGKARDYGFRGAFYAWESQDDGDDACTLFNITDVFTNRPLRTYFRDKQIHISADVVHAFWRYYLATADDTILLEGGAEVVFECSRFLLSYLYYSREKSRWEILDVTGPDEYHERVHNNAYTNWMTAQAFNACLQAAARLEERWPAEARALVERLDFKRDLEEIKEASARLFLPAPDPETGIIPQFDGYLALEDVAVEGVLRRKLHANEYLGGANGLAASTQVIKQADVILGLFLTGERSRAVKKANWEYYEPRTEHGSSLSACAYSLIAADIGKIDQAYRYFMQAASADLSGNHKSYVGTLYIGGTHPASSGGAWMAVVFGLCGIRVSGNAIIIEPRLPPHWSMVSIPVVFRGRRLAITVCGHRLEVDAVPAQEEESPAGEILIRAGGATYHLPESGTLSILLSAEGLRRSRLPGGQE